MVGGSRSVLELRLAAEHHGLADEGVVLDRVDLTVGVLEVDDVAALAAARKTSESVASLNSTWDELLIPAEPEEDEAAGPIAAEHVPDEQPASSEENGQALKLIESLLARKNLFEGTRQELRDYKEDIAAGEFHTDDLRYLKSLSRRLQKSG